MSDFRIFGKMLDLHKIRARAPEELEELTPARLFVNQNQYVKIT